MLKSDKKVRELSEILSKGNNTAIVEYIEFLRQETPFEGVIGLLASYYDKTKDYSVRKTISEFMNDLKDQSACIEVIAETKKKLKNDTIGMLVSSCWQSGLNYSEFSLDIAKVFVKGDYITAIECLTVIEESVQNIGKERKTELINFIRENAFPSGNEKTTLTNELLTILNR
jgi:hypothetical protein